MYPQSHFLFPLLIGLILEKLGYVGFDFVLVAVLVGVLVDMDHPLHHFFTTGQLSITATADDAFKKHIDDRTFLHHKLGMLVTTLFFIILWKYFPYWTAALTVGYYSHMLLDHVTADGRLLDNRTDKDYLGKGRPVLVYFCGYTIKIAKFEIAFDALCVVGLMVVFLV
jgi:hypothetical protein